MGKKIKTNAEGRVRLPGRGMCDLEYRKKVIAETIALDYVQLARAESKEEKERIKEEIAKLRKALDLCG